MRDAFETVSVGVIRYLSSQAAPAPAQPAFSNFDFSALFSTPGGEFNAVENTAATSQSAAMSQTFSTSTVQGFEAANEGRQVESQAEAPSLRSPGDQGPTMSVPNAVNAIDRFFSNPFIELGAINDLDLTHEPSMRSSATAKRTAILDQAFRS